MSFPWGKLKTTPIFRWLCGSLSCMTTTSPIAIAFSLMPCFGQSDVRAGLSDIPDAILSRNVHYCCVIQCSFSYFLCFSLLVDRSVSQSVVNSQADREDKLPFPRVSISCRMATLHYLVSCFAKGSALDIRKRIYSDNIGYRGHSKCF